MQTQARSSLPSSGAVHRRRRLRVAGVALLLAGAGCFPARTVPRDELKSAWPIQIRYARPTPVIVTHPLGTSRILEGVTELRGVLTTLDGDSAVVTAATATVNRRAVELRPDEIVRATLAASQVARIQQEQFSGKRTLAMVGSSAALVVVALALLVVIVVRAAN